VVYWSCTDFSQGLDEEGDLPFEQILGSRELAEYLRLRVPKRKREWLASRTAVKKLIRKALPSRSTLEDQRIETIKDVTGVPHVEIDGTQVEGQLSLSHSQGKVLCAYSPLDISLGVDIERIEARSPEFVEDYFTENEIRQVTRAADARQAFLATLVWSAKEAVLKALSLGLNLDTRSIEIRVDEATESSTQEWQSLQISGRLNETSSLHVYWRREDEFVLTLCSSDDSAPVGVPSASIN